MLKPAPLMRFKPAHAPLLALAFLLPPFALFNEGVAHADTAVFGNPYPVRVAPAGASLIARNQGQRPLDGISYDDCVKGIQVNFPLAVTLTGANTSLQVWAGAGDCSDLASRTAPAGACYPVTSRISPLAAAMTITVLGTDIAQAVGSTALPTYTPASTAACSKQQTSAGTNITLSFLFLDGNNNVADTGTTLTFPMLVDTVGPAAPQRSGAIGIGDTLLNVNWTPQTDPDTFGFRVFGSPPRGSETLDASALPPIDAGTVAPAVTCAATATPPVDDSGVGAGVDAGADGGGGAEAGVDAGNDAGVTVFPDAGVADACVPTSSSTSDGGVSTPLVACTNVSGTTVFPGPFVDGTNGSVIPPDYQIGEIDNSTASSLVVNGLQDNVVYSFAVGAVDLLGNSGPVTVIGCEFPSAIDDFWQQYRTAGGQAGGGFCALHSVGLPVGGSIFGIALLATGLVWARRRRRF